MSSPLRGMVPFRATPDVGQREEKRSYPKGHKIIKQGEAPPKHGFGDLRGEVLRLVEAFLSGFAIYAPVTFRL